MGCSAKVRESRYECEGIRSLHEHECHRRPEEYDIGGRVFDKEFAFEPFLPECYCIIGEPVILEGINIVFSQPDVVEAEICVVRS